jgi:hypothetical protein
MYLDKPNNKNRNKAFIRHHRNRIIKNKTYIAISIYNWSKDFLDKRHAGKFDKGKVHCSCKMCRYEQINGIERFKNTIKITSLKQEVKDYFSNI